MRARSTGQQQYQNDLTSAVRPPGISEPMSETTPPNYLEPKLIRARGVVNFLKKSFYLSLVKMLSYVVLISRPTLILVSGMATTRKLTGCQKL